MNHSLRPLKNQLDEELTRLAPRDPKEGAMGKVTFTDYSRYADLPIFPVPKNEKHEKMLRECIVAEFMNIQEPGVMNTCTYGSTKKKNTFKFFHGATYRIPRFLKEHMERLGDVKWKWESNGQGQMIKSKGGMAPRFQFREIYE